MNWLRVIAAPVIGTVLGVAAKWVGIELTEEQVATGGGAIYDAIMLGTAMVGSKVVASKINPGDAASRTIAEVEKQEHKTLKAQKRARRSVAN